MLDTKTKELLRQLEKQGFKPPPPLLELWRENNNLLNEYEKRLFKLFGLSFKKIGKAKKTVLMKWLECKELTK